MRRTLPIYCLASLFALLSSADAAVLTFQFSGNVIQVPQDDVFGDIAVGDAIRGSYSFDTSAADLLPADPALGKYTFSAPFGMTVNVGAHEFSTSGLLDIGIEDIVVNNPFLGDQYSVFAQSAANDLTMALFLIDPTHSGFTNDRLPLTAPPLATFTQNVFRLHAILGDGDVFVDGQLSALTVQAVPEPYAAGPMLAGSIILLALAGRRRLLKFS